ncbi:MAG: DUF6455 family protein [Pseudomonadota bacterium]
MFEILEATDNKLHLLGQMTQVTGAKPQAETPLADDTFWTNCVTACLACPCAQTCSTWLAQANSTPSTSPQQAPDFCSNAEGLNRVAATLRDDQSR